MMLCAKAKQIGPSWNNFRYKPLSVIHAFPIHSHPLADVFWLIIDHLWLFVLMFHSDDVRVSARTLCCTPHSTRRSDWSRRMRKIHTVNNACWQVQPRAW